MDGGNRSNAGQDRGVSAEVTGEKNLSRSSVSPEEAMMENAANDVSKPKPGLLKKLGNVFGRRSRSSSIAEDHVDSREFYARQQKDGEASYIPREEHPLWKSEKKDEPKEAEA